MKPCLSTLFHQYNGLWGVFTVKKTQLYTTFWLTGHARVQIFTYKDVCVCNVSPNFHMFYDKRRVSKQISRLCHVHAQVHTLGGQSFFVDGVYILWWLCTRIYWDIWLGKTAVHVWTNVRVGVGGHETRPKPKPNVDYYSVTYYYYIYYYFYYYY